jgi:hypothetical protein
MKNVGRSCNFYADDVWRFYSNWVWRHPNLDSLHFAKRGLNDTR